jgi:hypothetical protein
MIMIVLYCERWALVTSLLAMLLSPSTTNVFTHWLTNKYNVKEQLEVEDETPSNLYH